MGDGVFGLWGGEAFRFGVVKLRIGDIARQVAVREGLGTLDLMAPPLAPPLAAEATDGGT